MKLKICVLAFCFMFFVGCFALETECAPKIQAPACIIPCNQKQIPTNEKITLITFYIEQQAQQQENFIEMSLTIKEKDTSLKKAIDKATRKIQSIKQACEQYCKKNKGDNCEERLQVDNFKLEAGYQMVRRQPNFNSFSVTHKVKIVVLETQNVGQLVDILLGLGIYQIDQLEWKPHVQVDLMERAIDAGISKGRELCNHINRKIGAILSINQIFDENKDDQKQDEEGQASPNQDEDQDDEQPSVLKFQVQCIGSTIQQAQNQKKGAKSSKKKQKKK